MSAMYAYQNYSQHSDPGTVVSGLPATSPQYQQLAWQSPDQPIERETPEPQSQSSPSSSWGFLASLSSTLLLVGYMLIPLSFGDLENNSRLNKTSVITAASVFIGVAYALMLMLVFIQCHERSYLLYSVFLPFATANLLALFNVLLSILGRDQLPINNVEVASIGLSGGFALICVVCAFWVYARDFIEETRPVGSERRQSDQATALLTEEEMQRQQLMRLLQDKESKKKLRPRMMHKTYQVDVPERINPGKGWDSFMPLSREDGYQSR